MKKVLLLNTNVCQAPYPVPPVGLCLAAAALDGRYEVRIYDGVRHQPADLERTVRAFAPDYVGAGIRNVDDASMNGGRYFIPAILSDFIEPVRRLTSAPMILGGSGFSLFPRELMAAFDADYGIVGEAEESFPSLLAALDAGKDPAGIPGVISKSSRKPCEGSYKPSQGSDAPCPSPVAGRPADLSRQPFSDIAARLDYGPYAPRGAYSVQTQRGCRHDCLYCSYPYLEGRTLRQRPVASVVDEIEQAREKLGDVAFEFVDAVLNDPPGRLEAICREIIRRKFRPRLRTMGINPAHVTGELLDLMRDAGFSQIDATPDSGSADMLRSLRKNFSLAELRNAAVLIRGRDMPTMWFFLLGGPGESERTVAETLRFIDEFVAEADMVYIMVGLRIYPMTGLREIAVRQGIIGAEESLLEPKFYVSPEIGAARLSELVRQATATRPNCFAAGETSPPPHLLEAAARLRAEQRLAEPMFRTLLRLRRQSWR